MEDLYRERAEIMRKLEASVKNLRKAGSDYANAERNYKVTLRKKVLELRDQGYAVGIIEKTCYGIAEVADARFERDTMLTIYEANKESINVFKLELKVIDGQISREWNSQ